MYSLDFSNNKKWYYTFIFTSHLLPIFFLTTYSLMFISSQVIPAYLALSALFVISTAYSLNIVSKYQTGIFSYLLNIMFLLGFWFKFSVQKITSLKYREPIGSFQFSPESDNRILWVIFFGILAFLLSQICSYYFLKKSRRPLKVEKKSISSFKFEYILIACTAIMLALINLKFNILLFGLKPSLILPLKGNAVYFLLLTRGLIFLFFYYCFRSYSNSIILWGALLAMICSIGVMSRMVILTFFAVIFVYTLQNMQFWKLKTTFLNIFLNLIIFSFFSYTTVLGSTGLRNLMYDKERDVVEVSIPEQKVIPMTSPEKNYFSFQDKIQLYKELALGRWIGIEGVLAVDSYPNKGFKLLLDGLMEKSYNGNSFYTSITNPEALGGTLAKVISTSVPGPIAFFYYAGSIPLMFVIIFLLTLFFSVLEHIAFSAFYQVSSVGIFISVFMVFDFFQFGISPLAFVRYLCFSVLSITFFYYIIRHQLSKGFNENN